MKTIDGSEEKNSKSETCTTITSFGITVNWSWPSDFRAVAARLFICPRINSVRALRYVDMMRRGRMSVEGFLETTQRHIDDLNWRISKGVSISDDMEDNLEDWTLELGEPTEEDYQYLEKEYGFTRQMLYGEVASSDSAAISSAKEMASIVKEYVKGQDDVVDSLAVPFFQHLESKRMGTTAKIKCPVVLMGPTGSGKSEILRRFGDLCDCPVVRVNTIDIVPNGWRGNHLSDVLALYLDDKCSLKDWEYAIIVFNEFDKITHYNMKQTAEDMDGDFMREIMRLFETGYSIIIDKGDGGLMSNKFELPTQNLFVVFDGAFLKMEEVVKKRMNVATSIGFNHSKNAESASINYMKYVNEDDLISWGYMPELVGRIGQVQALSPLTSDMIYQIMTTAKDSILHDHLEYCRNYNLDVKFEESALRYISDLAYKSGLGFRNVKTILSKCMNTIYYEYCCSSATREKSKPKTIKIDKDFVVRQLKVMNR